jgi:hypothetical protein
MTYPVDYFTGDGTSKSFTLSQIPASATSILVHISGVKQTAAIQNPAYTLSGNILTFPSAPLAGSAIEVIYMGVASQVNVPGAATITSSMLSLSVANSYLSQFTATGSQNTFTLYAPPVSANSLIVTANGVVQYDYSVNAASLILNFTPPAGTIIRAQALSLAQASVPADGSVTATKYANYSIPTTAYANNSIANTALANGSIGIVQLDTGSANGTGMMVIPTGTTAQRPASAANGAIRFNTTLGYPEWYSTSATSWQPFTSTGPYVINYLLVGGGGGGASNRGAGGGGAGGFITGATTVIPGTSYTLTVGAGGTNGRQGGAGDQVSTSGLNTTGFSLTAIGGGYGASNITVQNAPYSGAPGGSGGGGGGAAAGGGTGGSGTPGQGNPGGSSSGGATTSNLEGGGGGGGAGGAGSSTTTAQVGGPGGVGLASSISGSPTYYAGGGGGAGSTIGGGSATQGTGGNGGGGSGTASGTAGSGTTNTGGGGGGSGNQPSVAGAGGSGIIIISYTGLQKGIGGTVTGAGGNTIHTFTSSGTFTA